MYIIVYVWDGGAKLSYNNDNNNNNNNMYRFIGLRYFVFIIVLQEYGLNT